ncbi:hypothetical protein SKAU_G00259890 [Synaphobranchus kaupii]|uniref:Phosphatidylinositol-specific phospholipase C X domain-containing protein n=1 Tax=Synaphobranchus kaupii TaxID=118154 RepID=A0A9Q1F4N4_SYNKA|nr:hypothetical protein SKAU_G00259890 [Synaphobranchus kaupii]
MGDANISNKQQDPADWMSQLPERLWDEPLYNLALPGSHDTMTYCLDLNSPLLVSNPLVLKVLDRLIPCIVRPCLYKWGTTQVQKICTQLDVGIRYFDLRIAHKKHDVTSALYFAHGVYTLLTVKDTLRDVAKWLNSHPKEVVILACSMFEGLNTDLHQDIILFLKNLFGSKIFPRSEEPATLRMFWKLGYQVIISYDDSAASGHEELWPQIPYWWADQIDPREVLSYLEKQKQSGRPEGFFVAGLNLTEDTQYVLTHPCQSIKTVTLHNYQMFLDWVEKQFPGPGRTCLNIICGDFVGNSDFVFTVIDLNNKLAEGLTL